MKKSIKGRRRVTLSIQAPGARRVSLVGDFNDWKDEVHPMQKKEDGTWEKTVMLPPGRYEYKFKVDEDWICDPENRENCENQYGTRNSVLNVEPK